MKLSIEKLKEDSKEIIIVWLILLCIILCYFPFTIALLKITNKYDFLFYETTSVSTIEVLLLYTAIIYSGFVSLILWYWANQD